jgi:hypothetical protein
MNNTDFVEVESEAIENYSVQLPKICKYFSKAIVYHKVLGKGIVTSAEDYYFYVTFSDNYRTYTFNCISNEFFSHIDMLKSNYDALSDEFVKASERQKNKLILDKIEADKKKQFIQWKDKVDSVMSNNIYPTHWLCGYIYQELDEIDRKLSSVWARDEIHDDFTMAKMLSARAAEKVAIMFYESLGHSVNDISITQVSKTKHLDWVDWKLCDLVLDDKICIDVKNARTSVNSKCNYVEHCVNKFKNDRKNNDIIITGILSPYVKIDLFNDASEINTDLVIKYLGETTNSYIKKLEEWFTRKLLTVKLDNMNFVPRWLFEFPDKFYSNRNMCRSILRNFVSEHQNIEFLNMGYEKVNPIPAYLSSGIELPKEAILNLFDWQLKFYNRIIPKNNKSITMPVLFLALLTHFLEIITQEDKYEDYHPDLYTVLLYNHHDYSLPLGIFDPLETIHDFIETLTILWSHKEKADLKCFGQFKFNGVGLLQGKRIDNTSYETILAYCGGFIEGRGKCGNAPLILGENDNCPSCGKLICEICGHCSTNCSDCSSRMEDYKENPRKTIPKTNKHYYLRHQFIDDFSDDVPF